PGPNLTAFRDRNRDGFSLEWAAGLQYRRRQMTNAGGNVQSPSATTETAGQRREVVVNGRRVKVIDLHAHCSIPEAIARMGDSGRGPGGGVRGSTGLPLANVRDRLMAMDEQGIDVEALSI